MPPKEKSVNNSQQEAQQQEDDKSKKPVAGKRQKIVKACKDCRRRKVRHLIGYITLILTRLIGKVRWCYTLWYM